MGGASDHFSIAEELENATAAKRLNGDLHLQPLIWSRQLNGCSGQVAIDLEIYEWAV
jgi:hypothetical protein